MQMMLIYIGQKATCNFRPCKRGFASNPSTRTSNFDDVKEFKIQKYKNLKISSRKKLTTTNFHIKSRKVPRYGKLL